MTEVFVAAVRILIVDDHDVMRGGLRSLLESRPGWEVCGEASNSADAIEQARLLRPDVVVLDISMPGFSGLEAVPLIRKETPKSEVLILSRHEEREMRLKALEAGARGYVTKSQGLARELLAAIDGIVREKTAFPG
jgi:DNA-binding NarL/FixJ family response regulator